MKSKWTTYMLLAGVLAIWGLIAWRVFFKSPEVVTSNAHPPVAKVLTAEPDTLFLSYADPFLGRTLVKTEVKATKKSPAVQSVKKEPQVKALPVVHNIKYIGNIKKNGILYCLADIGGKFITLAVGEAEGEYKLVNIYADSVRFMKGKELFIVK